MKRLACALLVLPLCLAVTAARVEDKGPETLWYPLREGTTWHYRAGDSKFQMRVAPGSEKIGDLVCARVDMIKDGKTVASEFIGVKASGVYRCRVQADRPNQNKDNPVLVETPKPPILLLPLPPKKGETFTVDSKVEPSGKVYKGTFKIAEETIKIGDKEYKCVVVAGQDLEGDGLKPTLTTWYAENVGMVKLVIAVADQKIDIELEKFEKGP
jgi:hypothetical protein